VGGGVRRVWRRDGNDLAGQVGSAKLRCEDRGGSWGGGPEDAGVGLEIDV
jgi:hypothetical protein